ELTRLQPILYEVLALEDSEYVYQPRNTYSPYPSSDQFLYVKHLVLRPRRAHTPQEEIQVLSMVESIELRWQEVILQCPNLQDVAIWCEIPDPEPTLLSQLACILHSPLRTIGTGLLRLSVALAELFSYEIDFNHEALKHLTHLEILDGGDETFEECYSDKNNFGCLKNLKYLAFTDCFCVSRGIIKRSLIECKSLEVLVVGEVRDNDLEAFLEELPKSRRTIVGTHEHRVLRGEGPASIEEIPEDRVVVNLPSGPKVWDEWMRGGEEGIDIWTRAEKVVRQRREGREKREVA
ncbi:hypothetical protein AX16_010535, partial [Volvariella volvacea WC 439]